MQVFLPWPNYEWSLRSLDTLRLGKQITEAYQLVKTSLRLSKGHPHHPARRHYSDEDAIASLVEYTVLAERVLRQRTGGTNVAAPKTLYSLAAYAAAVAGEDLPPLPEALAGLDVEADMSITTAWREQLLDSGAPEFTDTEPWGVGHPALHLSHQFNLCRKRPDIYSAVFGIRSWDIAVFKRGRNPSYYLNAVWAADESDPLVDVEVEPYMWPISVGGERLFQVGTATAGRGEHAELFGADPDGRSPLYVTPDEALERLRRDHPAVLDRYDATVRLWRTDPDGAAQLEHRFAELLASRTQPWPDVAPPPVEDEVVVCDVLIPAAAGLAAT